MASLREALAAVRVVVAGLVPSATDTSGVFTEMDGLFRTNAEIPTGDRFFEVTAIQASPEPTGELASDSQQFKAAFKIAIRYDALRDIVDIGDRMAEDAEQIIIAVEATAGYAADVQIIQKTPGSEDTGEGDFLVRTLPFEVTYRRAI